MVKATRAQAFGVAVIGSILLAGCALVPGGDRFAGGRGAGARLAPDPGAVRLPPLETRHFTHVGNDQELIGDLQVLFAHHEDTFAAIARVHDLGYQELRDANPDVDPWLPGEGTPVFLPTLSVIATAPREGIVLNLPSMRLLFFSTGRVGEGSDAGTAAVDVTSHPVGIGRQGWATPTGSTAVVEKVRDPAWYPPASVRAEHAALGDPLSAVVPPGPDNPLGRFALALSLPGYLIHGTNKPPGVGMRVSHGCVRLYPEDIAALFDRVPRGTPVHIVNQPVLAGWRGQALYLEAHPPLVEDERSLPELARTVIAAALDRRGRPDVDIDWRVVDRVLAEQRGVPFPILRSRRTLEAYLAAARVIENPASSARQAALGAEEDDQ